MSQQQQVTVASLIDAIEAFDVLELRELLSSLSSSTSTTNTATNTAASTNTPTMNNASAIVNGIHPRRKITPLLAALTTAQYAEHYWLQWGPREGTEAMAKAMRCLARAEGGGGTVAADDDEGRDNTSNNNKYSDDDDTTTTTSLLKRVKILSGGNNNEDPTSHRHARSIAMLAASFAMIRLLVEVGGADVNLSDPKTTPKGVTPLLFACGMAPSSSANPTMTHAQLGYAQRTGMQRPPLAISLTRAPFTDVLLPAHTSDSSSDSLKSNDSHNSIVVGRIILYLVAKGADATRVSTDGAVKSPLSLILSTNVPFGWWHRNDYMYNEEGEDGQEGNGKGRAKDQHDDSAEMRAAALFGTSPRPFVCSVSPDRQHYGAALHYVRGWAREEEAAAFLDAFLALAPSVDPQQVVGRYQQTPLHFACDNVPNTSLGLIRHLITKYYHRHKSSDAQQRSPSPSSGGGVSPATKPDIRGNYPLLTLLTNYTKAVFGSNAVPLESYHRVFRASATTARDALDAFSTASQNGVNGSPSSTYVAPTITTIMSEFCYFRGKCDNDTTMMNPTTTTVTAAEEEEWRALFDAFMACEGFNINAPHPPPITAPSPPVTTAVAVAQLSIDDDDDNNNNNNNATNKSSKVDPPSLAPPTTEYDDFFGFGGDDDEENVGVESPPPPRVTTTTMTAATAPTTIAPSALKQSPALVLVCQALGVVPIATVVHLLSRGADPNLAGMPSTAFPTVGGQAAPLLPRRALHTAVHALKLHAHSATYREHEPRLRIVSAEGSHDENDYLAALPPHVALPSDRQLIALLDAFANAGVDLNATAMGPRGCAYSTASVRTANNQRYLNLHHFGVWGSNGCDPSPSDEEEKETLHQRLAGTPDLYDSLPCLNISNNDVDGPSMMSRLNEGEEEVDINMNFDSFDEDVNVVIANATPFLDRPVRLYIGHGDFYKQGRTVLQEMCELLYPPRVIKHLIAMRKEDCCADYGASATNRSTTTTAMTTTKQQPLDINAYEPHSGLRPLSYIIRAAFYAMDDVSEGNNSEAVLALVAANASASAPSLPIRDRGGDRECRMLNAIPLNGAHIAPYTRLSTILDLVDTFVARGYALNAKESSGCTALHHSCVNPCFPSPFADGVADGQAITEHDLYFIRERTCPHNARFAVCRYLLTRHGADPNICNKINGYSPLTHALTRDKGHANLKVQGVLRGLITLFVHGKPDDSEKEEEAAADDVQEEGGGGGGKASGATPPQILFDINTVSPLTHRTVLLDVCAFPTGALAVIDALLEEGADPRLVGQEDVPALNLMFGRSFRKPAPIFENPTFERSGSNSRRSLCQIQFSTDQFSAATIKTIDLFLAKGYAIRNPSAVQERLGENRNVLFHASRDGKVPSAVISHLIEAGADTQKGNIMSVYLSSRLAGPTRYFSELTRTTTSVRARDRVDCSTVAAIFDRCNTDSLSRQKALTTVLRFVEMMTPEEAESIFVGDRDTEPFKKMATDPPARTPLIKLLPCDEACIVEAFTDAFRSLDGAITAATALATTATQRIGGGCDCVDRRYYRVTDHHGRAEAIYRDPKPKREEAVTMGRTMGSDVAATSDDDDDESESDDGDETFDDTVAHPPPHQCVVYRHTVRFLQLWGAIAGKINAALNMDAMLWFWMCSDMAGAHHIADALLRVVGASPHYARIPDRCMDFMMGGAEDEPSEPISTLDRAISSGNTLIVASLLNAGAGPSPASSPLVDEHSINTSNASRTSSSIEGTIVGGEAVEEVWRVPSHIIVEVPSLCALLKENNIIFTSRSVDSSAAALESEDDL